MKDPEKYGYPKKKTEEKKDEPKLKRMNSLEEKHFMEHLKWH